MRIAAEESCSCASCPSRFCPIGEHVNFQNGTFHIYTSDPFLSVGEEISCFYFPRNPFFSVILPIFPELCDRIQYDTVSVVALSWSSSFKSAGCKCTLIFYMNVYWSHIENYLLGLYLGRIIKNRKCLNCNSPPFHYKNCRGLRARTKYV